MVLLHPPLGSLVAGVVCREAEKSIQIGAQQRNFVVREVAEEIGVVTIVSNLGSDILVGKCFEGGIEDEDDVFRVSLVAGYVVRAAALVAVRAHDVEIDSVGKRMAGLPRRGAQEAAVGP